MIIIYSSIESNINDMRITFSSTLFENTDLYAMIIIIYLFRQYYAVNTHKNI